MSDVQKKCSISLPFHFFPPFLHSSIPSDVEAEKTKQIQHQTNNSKNTTTPNENTVQLATHTVLCGFFWAVDLPKPGCLMWFWFSFADLGNLEVHPNGGVLIYTQLHVWDVSNSPIPVHMFPYGKKWKKKNNRTQYKHLWINAHMFLWFLRM